MASTTTTSAAREAWIKAEIDLTRTYPHPRAKVWRAITEPPLMERWLMRPEGFAAVVGTRFKLVAKPQPGWRGYVDCEVLEVVPERRLRFSWVGDENRAPMTVTFSLEDDGSHTRFRLQHVGFEGLSGWFLAKLMMGPGWKKMLAQRLPAALDQA
jgi:uncharacterized protein YndB with AHSA1/START domain